MACPDAVDDELEQLSWPRQQRRRLVCRMAALQVLDHDTLRQAQATIAASRQLIRAADHFLIRLELAASTPATMIGPTEPGKGPA